MRRLAIAIAVFGLIAAGCGGGKTAPVPVAAPPAPVTTTTTPSAILPPVPAGEYKYQGTGRFNISSIDGEAMRNDGTYEAESSMGQRQRFWNVSAPKVVTEVEYRDDGVYLVKNTGVDAGSTFAPPEPLMLLPLPADTGRTASFDAVSADGCKRLEYKARVDGATTVEVGGKSVNAVQVAEIWRYEDTGKEQCETGTAVAQVTNWYLPQYYLPIRQAISITDDTDISADSTEFTSLLRSPIPL